jgi:hypothetical protein
VTTAAPRLPAKRNLAESLPSNRPGIVVETVVAVSVTVTTRTRPASAGRAPAASIGARTRREATGPPGTRAAGRSAAPSTSHPGNWPGARMAAMHMASRPPGPWHRFGAGPARHAPGMRLLHRTRYPLVQPAARVAGTPPSPAMLVLTLGACEYVRWTRKGYVALRRPAKEHLVIEHRIARRRTCSGGQGLPQPSGDHSKQLGARSAVLRTGPPGGERLGDVAHDQIR